SKLHLRLRGSSKRFDFESSPDCGRIFFRAPLGPLAATKLRQPRRTSFLACSIIDQVSLSLIRSRDQLLRPKDTRRRSPARFGRHPDRHKSRNSRLEILSTHAVLLLAAFAIPLKIPPGL